jgi:hypothetical protein
LIFDPFNFTITLLPIFVQTFLVLSQLAGRIVTKLLQRGVINCHSATCRKTRGWQCAHEIGSQVDYLALSFAFFLSFTIGAIFTPNGWYRLGMIIMGSGVLTLYFFKFSMSDKKLEEDFLTKWGSRITAIIYLIVSMFIHFFF